MGGRRRTDRTAREPQPPAPAAKKQAAPTPTRKRAAAPGTAIEPPLDLAAELAGAVVIRAVAGPDAIAGAALTANALNNLHIDATTKTQVTQGLAEVLPGRALLAGTAAADRTLPPATLSALIPSAAVVAAGFDPSKISIPVPPALWQSGPNALLVHVAQVHADLADGMVQITVPVTCDQTGDVDVTVTFVTGTPDRPAGGLATTEDHPRGPADVVENWAEPLIAFAWRTLIVATSALSGGAGGDRSGRKLITAGLAVSANGVTVTPMGRHAFLPGSAL
jgi:hypothetical protein